MILEKTLVLGSSGFLGSYFRKQLGINSGLFHSRAKLQNYDVTSSIENEQDVREIFTNLKFKHLVNCVALSNIDYCEKNESLASWLNTELPKLLSMYCLKYDVKFTHISTDAIFDGTTKLKSESDKTNPNSIYGKTKLAGEKLVLEANANSIVSRVNFFGWNPNGESIFNFFYRNLVEKNKVNGSTDIFFTPLYASTTANLILELMNRDFRGLIHVVGSERISKYDFAACIAKEFDLDSKLITPTSYLDTDFAKTRSADLSLSNAKLMSLGLRSSSISSGLKLLKQEIGI